MKEEAGLLLQINKHKSSAKMDAKERMIQQFLVKVLSFNTLENGI